MINTNDVRADDEEVELQMRATLALFKLDRQTSPEAMEIFFGNNIFRFQPVDGRSAWGSPVLRWTLPNAFAAFARRVIIDIPGSTWEDEDEFKACKQGLEVMARVLSGQDATNESDRPRALPRLKSLGLYFEMFDECRCDNCWGPKQYSATATPLLIEPLLALAARSVESFSVGYPICDPDIDFAPGLLAYCRNMQKVLEAGEGLEVSEDDRWKHNVCAPKYAWNSPEVRILCNDDLTETVIYTGRVGEVDHRRRAEAAASRG